MAQDATTAGPWTGNPLCDDCAAFLFGDGPDPMEVTL
jgi:hypothetical protein